MNPVYRLIRAPGLHFPFLMKYLGTALLNWILILGFVFPPAVFAAEEQPQENPRQNQNDDSLSRSIAELRRLIKGEINRHALDTFRLLSQEVFAASKPASVHSQNLQARIRTNSGDLQTFTSPKGFRPRASQASYGEKPQGLEIYHQDELIHFLRGEVRAAAFVGHYLAFIEDGSFIAEDHIQNISFIDLAYFQNELGKTALPVFRVPVQASREISGIELQNGNLIVGDKVLSPQAFAAYSDAQKIAFNVTVSLSDPKTYEESAYLSENFTEAFNRAIDMQGEDMKEQMRLVSGSDKNIMALGAHLQKALDVKSKLGPVTVTQAQDSLSGLEADKTHEALIQQSLQGIVENQKAQARVTSRLHKLWVRLSLPQPSGAPKIQRALALIAAGLRNQDGETEKSFKEGILEIINNPKVQVSAAVAAGIAMGYLYPAPLAAFFYSALDAGRVAGEVALGKALNFAYLAKESLKTSFGWVIHPSVVSETYFNARGAIGISALYGALLLTLGIPHLVVNSIRLFRELHVFSHTAGLLKGMVGDRDSEEYLEHLGWLHGLRQAFIDRENRVEREYRSFLAKKRENKTYSPDQDRRAKEQAAQMRIDHATPIERMLRALGASKLIAKYQGRSDQEITSLMGALTHFGFSFCSLTNSGRAFTAFWNSVIFGRDVVWHPFRLITILSHPHYFKTFRARGLERGVTIPTELNGGFAPIQERLYRKLVMRFQEREQYQALEAWEEKIIDVEAQIHGAAIREAFRALPQYMKSSSQLVEIYKGGGIAKVTDQALEKLTYAQRTFFRVYFEQVAQAAVEKFLRTLAASEDIEVSPDASLLQLKQSTLNAIEHLKLDSSKASEIVQSVATKARFTTATEAANHPVTIETLDVNLRHDLLHAMDPERNRQMMRIMLTEDKMKDPGAVARGTRAMLASNVVEQPLRLAFTLLGLASIHSGPFAPIQPVMFGHDSIFYLSKMDFAVGLIYTILVQMFAGLWMKVQQDSINDGKFGEIPSGEDAKRGRWRYVFKNIFQRKDNGFIRNYMEVGKLVIANLRANLTLITITNAVFLHRLDLDNLVTGYIRTFFMPLDAAEYQVEQGYELSTGYLLKDVDKDILDHPEVAKAYETVAANERLYWTFLWKSVDRMATVVLNNIISITTPLLGSRSFSRILMGGKTVRGAAAAGFEHIAGAPGQLPSVQASCDVLVKAISNEVHE